MVGIKSQTLADLESQKGRKYEEVTDTLMENEELEEKNERLKKSIASKGSELNRLISFRSKVYLEKFEQMSQSQAGYEIGMRNSEIGIRFVP